MKLIHTVSCYDRNEFESILETRIQRGEKIISAGMTSRYTWWAVVEEEYDADD